MKNRFHLSVSMALALVFTNSTIASETPSVYEVFHGVNRSGDPSHFYNAMVGHGISTCATQAYLIYATDGTSQPSKAYSRALSKAKNELRSNETVRAMASHIGLMVGMRAVNDAPESALSYYRASACALQKSEQIGITDPKVILAAIGVVSHSYTYKTKVQKWFDQNAQTGDIDLSELQQAQADYAANTAAFVYTVREIANMDCDISDAEADHIHTDYVMTKFLSKISRSAADKINKLSEQCAADVLNDVQLGLARKRGINVK